MHTDAYYKFSSYWSMLSPNKFSKIKVKSIMYNKILPPIPGVTARTPKVEPAADMVKQCESENQR